MSSIFCEPYPFGRPKNVYAENFISSPQWEIDQCLRQAEDRKAQEERARQATIKRMVEGDELTQDILEVCRQSDEAVRLTTLVNQVAKMQNPKNWQETEAMRLRVFQRISRLLRIEGRLEPVGKRWRYVTVARDQTKWKSYVDSLNAPLPDLPEPRLFF